jgi:hypothetical protein
MVDAQHRRARRSSERAKESEAQLTAESDEPREWIFTFGGGHVHPTTGESLSRRFVRLAGTKGMARACMVELFGIKWSHQYAADDGDDPAGVAQFGLEELPSAQFPPLRLFERWREFEDAYLPDAASDGQRRQLRVAFYNGVAALFLELRELAEANDSQIDRRFDELDSELRRFELAVSDLQGRAR